MVITYNKMEGNDEHLLVADVEVLCWHDQLRQVVS